MEKKIRVAMLGPYPFDPARIRGGVQAAYTYLVKGLSQTRALDLHVFIFQPHGYAGLDQIQQGSLILHLLPLYSHFERLRNYRTYQTMLESKLAQIRPDLIHVQDVAAEAFVAIRSGYPTVMTVHGIRREDRRHIRSLNQWLRNYFDSMFIEKYTLAHAKHLIAVSRYATEYYKSILRSNAGVHYIPNAVDERFFNLHGTPGENIVLFAGRVTPLKRVMDLVQAFALVVKQLPTAQLRIAGEMISDSAYAGSIRRWIQQAGLEDHIHLLGPLPETSILQEFAGCNILALSSAQESAPMVIAQAMAAGKPVVATRVGGVAEMVGETGQRGLLVEVGNVNQLAEAMIRLLPDLDLQSRLGQNGRAFARETYHIENIARRTAEIYRLILSEEQQINV